MTIGRRDTVLLDTRIDDAALLAEQRDTGHQIVQLAEPRKGVWSGNNQLGVELPFTPDAQREQTIFKMDEWGMPQVWTISLAFILERDLTVDEVFDATAEVLFGAGGVQQSFECDWVVGTVFSLPTNAVNIRARWNDLAAIAGIGPPEGARLSVQIARGSIRHARATKTIVFNAPTVPAGPPFPTPGIRIPSFAKSVIVAPFTAAGSALMYAATFFLQFLPSIDAASNSVLTVPGNLLGPTTSFKVPIPALSHYVRVINTAGTPIDGNLIFNLFDE